MAERQEAKEEDEGKEKGGNREDVGGRHEHAMMKGEERKPHVIQEELRQRLAEEEEGQQQRHFPEEEETKHQIYDDERQVAVYDTQLLRKKRPHQRQEEQHHLLVIVEKQWQTSGEGQQEAEGRKRLPQKCVRQMQVGTQQQQGGSEQLDFHEPQHEVFEQEQQLPLEKTRQQEQRQQQRRAQREKWGDEEGEEEEVYLSEELLGHQPPRLGVQKFLPVELQPCSTVTTQQHHQYRKPQQRCWKYLSQQEQYCRPNQLQSKQQQLCHEPQSLQEQQPQPQQQQRFHRERQQAQQTQHCIQELHQLQLYQQQDQQRQDSPKQQQRQGEQSGKYPQQQQRQHHADAVHLQQFQQLRCLPDPQQQQQKEVHVERALGDPACGKQRATGFGGRYIDDYEEATKGDSSSVPAAAGSTCALDSVAAGGAVCAVESGAVHGLFSEDEPRLRDDSSGSRSDRSDEWLLATPPARHARVAAAAAAELRKAAAVKAATAEVTAAATTAAASYVAAGPRPAARMPLQAGQQPRHDQQRLPQKMHAGGEGAPVGSSGGVSTLQVAMAETGPPSDNMLEREEKGNQAQDQHLARRMLQSVYITAAATLVVAAFSLLSSHGTLYRFSRRSVLTQERCNISFFKVYAWRICTEAGEDAIARGKEGKHVPQNASLPSGSAEEGRSSKILPFSSPPASSPCTSSSSALTFSPRARLEPEVGDYEAAPAVWRDSAAATPLSNTNSGTKRLHSVASVPAAAAAAPAFVHPAAATTAVGFAAGHSLAPSASQADAHPRAATSSFPAAGIELRDTAAVPAAATGVPAAAAGNAAAAAEFVIENLLSETGAASAVADSTPGVSGGAVAALAVSSSATPAALPTASTAYPATSSASFAAPAATPAASPAASAGAWATPSNEETEEHPKENAALHVCEASASLLFLAGRTCKTAAAAFAGQREWTFSFSSIFDALFYSSCAIVGGVAYTAVGAYCCYLAAAAAALFSLYLVSAASKHAVLYEASSLAVAGGDAAAAAAKTRTAATTPQSIGVVAAASPRPATSTAMTTPPPACLAVAPSSSPPPSPLSPPAVGIFSRLFSFGGAAAVVKDSPAAVTPAGIQRVNGAAQARDAAPIAFRETAAAVLETVTAGKGSAASMELAAATVGRGTCCGCCCCSGCRTAAAAAGSCRSTKNRETAAAAAWRCNKASRQVAAAAAVDVHASVASAAATAERGNGEEKNVAADEQERQVVEAGAARVETHGREAEEEEETKVTGKEGKTVDILHGAAPAQRSRTAAGLAVPKAETAGEGDGGASSAKVTATGGVGHHSQCDDTLAMDNALSGGAAASSRVRSKNPFYHFVSSVKRSCSRNNGGRRVQWNREVQQPLILRELSSFPAATTAPAAAPSASDLCSPAGTAAFTEGNPLLSFFCSASASHSYSSSTSSSGTFSPVVCRRCCCSTLSAAGDSSCGCCSHMKKSKQEEEEKPEAEADVETGNAFSRYPYGSFGSSSALSPSRPLLHCSLPVPAARAAAAAAERRKKYVNSIGWACWLGRLAFLYACNVVGALFLEFIFLRHVLLRSSKDPRCSHALELLLVLPSHMTDQRGSAADVACFAPSVTYMGAPAGC